MLSLEYLHQLWEKEGGPATPFRMFTLREHAFSNSGAPALMGVVNLSPDSWYRESVCLSAEQAVRRAKRLSTEGAAIIDLGAESTVLNAARADANSQKNLLLPVIRELSEHNILASIETYQYDVAKTCLEAGAAVLNLTGVQADSKLYHLVAEHDAGVIICYVNGNNVREVGDLAISGDHTQTLLDFFKRQIDLAVSAGVERIWLDPGMGFYYRNLQDSATRVRYQIETFLNTFRLHKLGWPVCHALPHAFEFFEEEVRSAEPFFAVLATLGKTNLLRTHEVAKVRGVVRSMETIK
jgi:dihydropteroate synthase